MIGNAEDLEDSKENIQPLKQGRVVSQLSMALKAQTDSSVQQELLEQQRYHEMEIRSYDGDDPLEPWYDYVAWVEQSFVKDGRASQLQLLLEKCLTKFKDNPRYHQDLRYIKLWITYIELQVHPQELYNSVFIHGIGTKSALFYRSWAYEFERIKDFKNADKVYRLAFENFAEPKEELEAAYQKFTMAVGQAALGYEGPVPEKPLDEQRLVLSKLHSGRKGQEDNAEANLYQRSELQHVPRRDVLTKENVQKPGPWTNAHRKTKLGAAAVSAPRVPGPHFPIHEDQSEGSPHAHHPSNDLLPTLKVRKHQVCDFKCPIAVFEQSDPTKRPMYIKDKVYAGNVEFSLEELRANTYRKRYAEGLKKLKNRSPVDDRISLSLSCGNVEQTSSERLTSHTDGSAAGYREVCQNLPQVIQSQQHAQMSYPDTDSDRPLLREQEPTKNVTEFFVPQHGSQSRAVFESDQSSLCSQSITVNTKEALKTVGELWKTPMDKWSPPSKPSQNICHSLFPGNVSATSEVKSVPFQIYPDDQSICQPSQPMPPVSEKKPIKSILKAPPKVLVHPPHEQLPGKCVDLAQGKENINFFVFHDDDNEDVDCPHQSETPKQDIPFVPSPGMSEEELSKLKDSEVKENIAPLGSAAVKRTQQVDADRILQLSKTVPFLPLEEQERLCSEEYNDLGVRKLPENSEIGNETCNTQAFCFPLPSSTPFTIHSRRFQGLCDDSEPEEGSTISLMMNVNKKKEEPKIVCEGNKKEEEPKIVCDGNKKEEGQKTVREANIISMKAPTPAGRHCNLSDVMEESSREYKSSSSSGSSGMVTRRTTYSVKESLGIIDEMSSRYDEGDKQVSIPQSGHRIEHQSMNVVYTREEKTEVQVATRGIIFNGQNSEMAAPALDRPDNVVEGRQLDLEEQDNDLSGHPVLRTLMSLTIDSDFDPFSDELQEMVLKRQNFPKYFESDYVRCTSDLPFFKSSSTVILGSEKFMLSEIIGNGAYAKLMKATHLGSDKLVALKIQNSSCDWEFYISRQIQKRLSDKSMVAAFIHPDAAFTFSNGSVLVLELLPYGNVLSVCNKVREKTGRCLNHLIATFWTRELLSIVRHLMKCNIIHGDMKPDNLMLHILPTVNLQVPTLKLIDYGRSIDMLQFPAGTSFKKVVTTDDFQCIEMQTKQEWTYQTDLYGVAGIAHCLLFGSYMKTYKLKSREWTIESSCPRYVCREEWKNFFGTLLNIENCDKIPDLLPLETAFQMYLHEQKASLTYAFNFMNNILNDK
ncbi:mitotic checkpoint serine/threonine-protein kinase BUB1 beta-like isoform X2 [Bacillus rossius redtenbacheri]|uniref:mitotic checkpoint serine/threonine-protein kinase BUB1 beta-like isoform X2 n=1 Tax=Bacillus rossius redtenbacheri TaxID=93214 RepID=UPI002FDD18A6